MRLDGRCVVVTGAGGGIGRASAELFAREGASVVAVDRDEAAVRATAAAIEAASGRVLALAADAGDETAVEDVFRRALDTFGRLDVVFANAGISGGLAPLLDQPVELWTEILRVNLIGAFLAIKHAAPIMTERGGGSIICTASVAGLRANAAGVPYSASKAGVISLVQTAANALAGTGIRVNAISPGLIETGMTESMFRRASERGTSHKIGQLNPLRRAGLPAEIASVALFLASDEASYVNGQAIAVDGGLSSTHPFAGAGRK